MSIQVKDEFFQVVRYHPSGKDGQREVKYAFFFRKDRGRYVIGITVKPDPTVGKKERLKFFLWPSELESFIQFLERFRGSGEPV